MIFKPMRAYGPWIGSLLGAAIFGFVFWGIGYSLGTADQALKVALLAPAYLFAGVFVILLVGSFTLIYRIEGDNLIIRSGLRNITVPLTEVNDIIKVTGSSNMFSILGASWPGYMVGLYSVKGLGPVRMYATRPQQGFVYLKTNCGFFGLTPMDDSFIETIAQRTEKEIQTVDMDQMSEEVKGKSMQKDNFYRLLYAINVTFLIVFSTYLAIFFPGSGAPRFIILLLVLAVALFFFNIGNAGRLYQFSNQGGYVLLVIGIAVTGTFLILALSEISL